MDTRVFCVYNVARGVLLSSTVTVADSAHQPLTILKVLVGGLAMDSKSGLWLSPIYGMPPVPRLFPFDLLYLDHELRVLDLAEFVPGVEFPPYRGEVVSALVLPSHSLQSTRTERGDRLLICLAGEMEGQIAALSTGPSGSVPTNASTAENPGQFPHPRVGPAPRVSLGSRFAARAGAAVAVVEEVSETASRSHLAAPVSGPSLQKAPPLTTVMAVADRSPDIAVPAPRLQERDQPTFESGTGQDEVDAAKGVLAVTGSEPIVASDLEKTANEPSAGEVQPNAPVMSITEVILERARTAEPPAALGLCGEVEDLFSNWMDTPTLASTWKSQVAKPPQIKPTIAPPVGDTPVNEPVAPVAPPETTSDSASSVAPMAQVASVETKGEPKNKPVAMDAAMNEVQVRQIPSPPSDSVAPASAETPNQAAPSKLEQELSKSGSPSVTTSPVSTPIRVALPQPAQATTSTAAQYGLWRASLPTAVIPVAAVKQPVQERSESGAASTTSKEAAKGSPDPKVEVSSSSASTSQAGLQRVEGLPRVTAVVQPASRYSEQVAKQSNGKAVEAAKNPIAPDNMLGADERPKRLSKVVIPAVRDKSAASEPVQTSGERLSVGPSAASTRAPATEAVDIVQRMLGIGHAKVPEAAAPVTVEKREATVKKIAVAESVKPARNVAATGLLVRKEPAAQGNAPPTRVEAGNAAQNGKLKKPTKRVEANGKTPAPPPTLAERFKRWLNPAAPTNSDRRRAHRRYVPGMVAHYYTGGAPKPHDIADISMTGFYFLTEDRWMPDTMIRMTLQKPCAKGERKQSITVMSKIVRSASDGVAAQFVMAESLDPESRDVQPSQTTDRFALARFI